MLHLCQYTWVAPCIYLCVICSSSAYKDVSECWNCTAGFHCSEPGRDSPVGPCDPGYYCPAGASSSQEVPCYPGTYCVGENEEPELCPIGTFQPNYTRTHISDCINCTAGRYCIDQIIVSILTEEFGMNGFIKQAAGSKRIYLSIVCTGDVLPSLFSNSIIHQVKTKEIMAVKMVWISGLN